MHRLFSSKFKGAGALLTLILAVTLTGCASGPQPGPTAIPLRPTEAADFEVADIEQLMSEMTEAGAPAVFVEIRDGEQVWSGVQGVRSTTSELPATVNDRVRIASLTKPMVASILLQLVEEGVVNLGDPIEDYLPGVVDGREVTVRQLLNHSSGMPDYVPALTLNDPSSITTQVVSPITHEELIDLSRTRDWEFEPGTGFEYSNSNYIVISMLIEELTGNELATELENRITVPLGLSSTSIPSGTDMGENAAHGYVKQGALSIDVTEQDASLWSGAGGVVSTVSDVNTFMRALLTGQVIPPELLGEMLVLLPQGYGLGVQSRTDTCPDTEAAYLESSNGAAESEAPMATESAPTDAGGESDASNEVPEAGADSEVGDAGSGGTDTADANDADGDQPEDTGGLLDEDSASTYDFEPSEEGSGSLHDSEYGELVQIGAPNHVYGHLGSGLGYRALTMSSPDGIRQVTIAWTVSPTDYADDPRLQIAYELADVALAIDC
ncbi:MAG: serine hydrolase [Gulosibacter sp.]|uniref:serine hydrolase domain-containing protein n=1 Tax=Gulosibacter sp. TaxID=2817531 RepID=UPI003F93F67E